MKHQNTSSPILSITLRWLGVLLVVVSLFLLLRGHNEPGGGFTGGLLAAGAVIITSIASGAAEARKLLRLEPLTYIAWGLLTSLLAGVLNISNAYLQAIWVKIPLGFTVLKIGTPLLFDIGVYLVVLGVVSAFALDIEDAHRIETEEHS